MGKRSMLQDEQGRTGMRMRIAAALVALAVAQPAAAQGVLDNIDNEDIGRVLGGIGGAVLGAQFGSGTGQLIATAAGAVGGLFLGGEIGKRLGGQDQKGIAATTERALETGETQTWKNPDTGVSTTAHVRETTYRPAPVAAGSGREGVVWRVPPMDLIERDYEATTTTNVRGGPGTDYAVMDQLRRGERVRVVGKMTEADWYMISEGGIGRGFVHADLLRPASGGTTAARPSSSDAGGVSARKCSLITQEVRMPDGALETRQARACRNEQGNWELV